MAKLFANSEDRNHTPHILWCSIWVCTVCSFPFGSEISITHSNNIYIQASVRCIVLPVNYTVYQLIDS